MKIRTAEALGVFIREDLAWRRKELRILDSLVKTSSDAKQQAVLRGAVAALYAHWEGYVKTAASAYIDFVRLQGLQICELQPNFVGLIVRGRVKQLAATGTAADYAEFVRWMLSEWHSRAYLPSNEKLSTQSNLSAVVFRDIVAGLGLPYRIEYQTAEKSIIEPLLATRNHLAHGEWERVEQATFEQYLMWIERLLLLLCESIEDASASRAFKRQAVQLA